MAASVDDKFQKQGVAGTITTLSAPGHSIGGTTIPVGSTTNWPTDTGITFAIRTVDASGNFVAGTYTEWRATVSGSTLTGMVLAYGTDQIYASGSTTQVYIPVSAYSYNRMIDGLLVHANQDGTLKDVLDANGNELLKWSVGSAAAVNDVTITNAATGAYPKIAATGDDTDIALRISGKGAQGIRLYSGDFARELVRVNDATSAINYFSLTPSAAGNPTIIANLGGDSSIDLDISPKGSGLILFDGVPVTGAWTDYTPSVSGSGSALGNGTTTGSYVKIGRTVIAKGKMVFGSTSTMGTAFNITLPASANTDDLLLGCGVIGNVGYFDSSSSLVYAGVARIESSSVLRLICINGYQEVAPSATIPFGAAWATGDTISWQVTYEAAA